MNSRRGAIPLRAELLRGSSSLDGNEKVEIIVLRTASSHTSQKARCMRHPCLENPAVRKGRQSDTMATRCVFFLTNGPDWCRLYMCATGSPGRFQERVFCYLPRARMRNFEGEGRTEKRILFEERS
jgi:hypothetical protein